MGALKIIPYTFVPHRFFWGTRIVKEKMGYNFPYGGKIRTKILIFGSFFSDLHIVPPNFLWGYNFPHVGGTMCIIWGYNV